MDESSYELERQVLDLASGALDELVQQGGAAHRTVRPHISALFQLVDVATEGPDWPAQRECLHAGLWILADELERAHIICQEIPNIFGSAWHAVVHRRDGDFWNSKYWWRRTAGLKWDGLVQRIRSDLAASPSSVLTCIDGKTYDPSRFVDLVDAHHARRAPEMHAALVTLQRLEWMSLFSQCLRGGGTSDAKSL